MNDVEIRRLTAPAPELGAMTFPAYRRLLSLERTSRHPEQGDRRAVDPLALAARRGGEPVGLILAELPAADEPAEDPRSAAVLSVYVRPEARRRGIASALFAELEGEVRARGFTELGAVYTAGKPGVEHVERIFARRGWEPPRPRTLSVRFTPRAALAAPLFAARRIAALERSLEIFPWSELEPEERREMEESNAATRWIVPALEPWRFDRFDFDPSSVGARYRGRVVGWVINHRVSRDVVRFTCSFMHKSLSRRGRILPLYRAALVRLAPTPCRYCTFVTPLSYGGMVGLIRRWIVPFASFVGETRGTRLRLG